MLLSAVAHVPKCRRPLENGPAHADSELFKQLDTDNDGRVTLDDLKRVLAEKNLPEDYAVQFINRARGAKWWASSITCAPLLLLACANLAALSSHTVKSATTLTSLLAARSLPCHPC